MRPSWPVRFDRRGNGKSSSSNPLWSAAAAARMAGRGGAAGSTGFRPVTNTRAAGRREAGARGPRRLDGLAPDYEYRIGELERDEPESPRIARFARDLRNLSHLRQ